MLQLHQVFQRCKMLVLGARAASSRLPIQPTERGPQLWCAIGPRTQWLPDSPRQSRCATISDQARRQAAKYSFRCHRSLPINRWADVQLEKGFAFLRRRPLVTVRAILPRTAQRSRPRTRRFYLLSKRPSLRVAFLPVQRRRSRLVSVHEPRDHRCDTASSLSFHSRTPNHVSLFRYWQSRVADRGGSRIGLQLRCCNHRPDRLCCGQRWSKEAT